MRRLVGVVSLVAATVSAFAVAAQASDAPIAMSLTGFQHIVVDDPAGWVFLSGASGVDVRDLNGAEVTTSLGLGAVSGLALSADGTLLYAAQPQQDSIAVIDTADLSVQGSITTGAHTCPKSLALVAQTLWFGYGCSGWSGAVGAIDLTHDPAVVSLGVADNGGIGYYSAPVLAASPVAPGELFVAEPSSSPSRIQAFTASGQSLSQMAETAATEPIGGVRDMTVSADGKDLLVATTQWRVLKYTTTDLTADGHYQVDNTPAAVASAADGSVAVGIGDANVPSVYTYASDETFTYQYAYADNAIAADAGVTFNADGSVLYAVTTTAGGTSYTLHVITNLSDTARPPAPEVVTATPDYRAIDLTWDRLGRFNPTDVDSFTIYRGTAPNQLAPYAQLPSNRATAQTWSDTGVASGTKYYYAVTATNAGGESDRTATVSTTRNDVAVAFVGRPDDDPKTDVSFSFLSDNGPMHEVAPAGHYSDPAASPDGTAVAYSVANSNARHLWRVALAGATAQQLTSGSGQDSWPTWSPDGTRIAFSRTTSSGTSIWTVPADGGAATPVPGTTGDREPAWSPNGALLAVTHGTGAASEIVVTSLDGGYRRAVTGTKGDLPHDLCFYDNQNQILCHYSGSAATWSPNGARLAFVQTTPGGTTPALVPSAGGTVDYSLFEPFSHTGSISWSPDGSRLVRSDETWLDTWELFQQAPDGSNPTRLGYGYHPTVTAPRDAYVPLSQPSAVTAVGATLSNRSVALHWTRPADSAYVTVRRSAANGPAPTKPTAGTAVYTGTGSTATATSLVNGATYQFAIFTSSAVGDPGAPVDLTAAPAATPAVAPTGSILSALYRSGPAFTASWGTTLPVGQRYDVQIGSRRFVRTTSTWSASPTWQNLLTGTTRTRQVVQAVAGTTYYLRARVRDADGHSTAWSAVAVAAVPYDDRALAASSGWSRAHAGGRFDGTLTTSSRYGAALNFTTSGSRFAIAADRCADCGQFRVYMDGHYRGTIDTHASATKARQLVWSYTLRSIGRHTVRIVAVGTDTHPQVHIDGLVAVR